MRKAIVMDVDQVLLDHTGRLREYFNQRFDKHITGQPGFWDDFNWLGVGSHPEFLDVIREFSEDYQFGTLDALPGADVVLHSLRNDDFKLVAVTACGTSELTKSLRLVNLFHRFGDIFDEVHFVEFNATKLSIFKDIQTRYEVEAFIDDKPENVQDILYGSDIPKVILMKAPHNRAFRETNTLDAIHYAYSWYDCKNLINNKEI